MKHITITGSLGSGKSVVSSILKNKLKIEIESVGSLLRQMAYNYGMSTSEFNKYMEEHPELDHELDSFVKEQGQNPIPKIFDSRLAWHFIPQSYKVYLYVKDEIAAKRVYRDKERVNEEYEGEDEALYHITERRKSEILRFKTQYNIDLDDFTNYNLIIDTSYSTPEDIANIIIQNYQKNSSDQNDIWISPYTLIPAQITIIQSLGKIENSGDSFSQEGNDTKEPVIIFFKNNLFYVVDGQKQVLNAIQNKTTLIPCVLVQPTNVKLTMNNEQ